MWKLDRPGRSLPRLLAVVADPRERGVALRPPTEAALDAATPRGELPFAVSGAPAWRERVTAGLAAAKRRGRPPVLDAERPGQAMAAPGGGASEAAVCRAFRVARSTLLDTLARAGWTGSARPDSADGGGTARPLVAPEDVLSVVRAMKDPTRPSRI